MSWNNLPMMMFYHEPTEMIYRIIPTVVPSAAQFMKIDFHQIS